MKPCKLWTKCLSSGYGQVSAGRRIHRVTWELAHGPIPPKMVIMHICDVRNCYELTHLRLGTHKENTQDMWNKGRQGTPRAPGEQNGQAKLTKPVVDKIRTEWPGSSYSALAGKYGVTKSTIAKIITKRTWR